MTEMEKIRPRISAYLAGRSVLELGCGAEKVCPWAVSCDISSPAADLKLDVSPRSGALTEALKGRVFDVLFSSHCLEHVDAPILGILRHWIGFVRPGGLMILYLPDERIYRYDPSKPTRRNPDHVHYLTMDTFRWFMEQLAGCDILEVSPDFGPDRHSFLSVVRRN